LLATAGGLFIKIDHDRYFKIHMVKKDGRELLVGSQNLEEQQIAMFEMET